MDYKKPQRGYQRVGKRKNWWMRNNCTRPTAWSEKTREFSLAFGQAALTFRTFCFPRAISWSSLLTFFAKE